MFQVEEALKILMAYCSLGEEYQVDYLLKRIKHWLHLRRIKKLDGNTYNSLYKRSSNVVI